MESDLQPTHFLERIGTIVAGRRVKLLHVEDEAIQHRMIMLHLKHYEEFDFIVTWVEGQSEAVRSFQHEKHDLVILDYHLNQGNGLDCVKEIRALNPIVPIVALSASEDARIAAELVKAGADDFLNKARFDSQRLRSSINAALSRADLFRTQAETHADRDVSRLKVLILSLGKNYLASYNPEILRLLDHIETTAKRVKLSEDQWEAVLEGLCASPGGCVSDDADLARIVIRPLRLELEKRIGLRQQP